MSSPEYEGFERYTWVYSADYSESDAQSDEETLHIDAYLPKSRFRDGFYRDGDEMYVYYYDGAWRVAVNSGSAEMKDDLVLAANLKSFEAAVVAMKLFQN